MKDRTHPNLPYREPTEEEIAKCAFFLWLEQGRPNGRDLEDWFAAKELLRHRHGRGEGVPPMFPHIKPTETRYLEPHH